MKKVIIMFVIMIVAALAAGMAFGEHVTYNGYNVYYGIGSETMDLIETFCEDNKEWKKWYDGDSSDGVYRLSGGLDIKSYEEETGNIFTVENYLQDVKEIYNMKEIDMTRIGQVDGYDVWLVEGVSFDEIVNDFKKVSIMGIMYIE